MKAVLPSLLLALALTAPARAQDTTTTTEPPVTTTTVTETTTTLPATTPTVTVTTLTLPTPTTLTTTTITLPTSTTVTTTTITLPAPPACIAGDPRSCDDGNPCTVDSCVGAFLTCVHHPLDGTPCPDDHVFCTEDRCVAGVCQHPPSDLRCDTGQCVMRTCRPGDPHADRAGCVLVHGPNRHDGAPCTDDGFSCTQDICTRGVCAHLPLDMDCIPGDACDAALCAPGNPAHGADGCVAGPPRSEGEECAEDADACTTDVCRAGRCAHEPVPAIAECSPVQPAYQRALSLGTLAEELGTETASMAPAGGLDVALDRLARIEADLDAAARALAGRPLTGTSRAEDVTRASLAVRPAVSATIMTDRARIAFMTVLRTPRQVSLFLQAVAEARQNRTLGQPAARHLRRQGRVLLRTTRQLRSELRVLQR